MTGANLANYRFLGPLRAGAMAELFDLEAADGQRWLLKRPRQAFGNHPAGYADFETERMVLARLTGTQVP